MPRQTKPGSRGADIIAGLRASAVVAGGGVRRWRHPLPAEPPSCRLVSAALRSDTRLRQHSTAGERAKACACRVNHRPRRKPSAKESVSDNQALAPGHVPNVRCDEFQDVVLFRRLFENSLDP